MVRGRSEDKQAMVLVSGCQGKGRNGEIATVALQDEIPHGAGSESQTLPSCPPYLPAIYSTISCSNIRKVLRCKTITVGENNTITSEAVVRLERLLYHKGLESKMLF